MKINEEMVARMWSSQGSCSLYRWKDKNIELIYPGRKTKKGGCDFEDAVFLIDSERITGDVEIHVKTSNWFMHRHHLNNRYRDIALHVVLTDDNEFHTITSEGRVVPTISLDGGLVKICGADGKWNQGGASSFCRGEKAKAFNSRIYKIIWDAADQRLLSKINTLKMVMDRIGLEQLLYQYIARALGYSLNSIPFQELTRRLPVSSLYRMMCKINNSAVYSCIMGMAGLLPSQREGYSKILLQDEEILKLEEGWLATGNQNTMKESDWILYGIRPQNRPVRRLIALGSLLIRFKEAGLVTSFMNAVREYPGRKAIDCLHNELYIGTDGYWGEHVDFGVPLRKKAALLGGAKASDIIINTVFPFFCAYGERQGDLQLANRSRNLYYDYPASSGNQITDYMSSLLKVGGRLKKSGELQGLLHIYHNYCRQKQCDNCPVATVRN